MTDADLCTLMDREAERLEAEDDHCAAVLMRVAADRIRTYLQKQPRFYADGRPTEAGQAAAKALFGDHLPVMS